MDYILVSWYCGGRVCPFSHFDAARIFALPWRRGLASLVVLRAGLFQRGSLEVNCYCICSLDRIQSLLAALDISHHQHTRKGLVKLAQQFLFLEPAVIFLNGKPHSCLLDFCWLCKTKLRVWPDPFSAFWWCNTSSAVSKGETTTHTHWTCPNPATAKSCSHDNIHTEHAWTLPLPNLVAMTTMSMPRSTAHSTADHANLLQTHHMCMLHHMHVTACEACTCSTTCMSQHAKHSKSCKVRLWFLLVNLYGGNGTHNAYCVSWPIKR